MTEYLVFLEEARKVLEVAKKNISEDELEPAFDSVLDLTKKFYRQYESEIILKKQRYSKLKYEKRSGILSLADMNLVHAQICHSFLGTISEIEKKIDEDLKREKTKYQNYSLKNTAQNLDFGNRKNNIVSSFPNVGLNLFPEHEKENKQHISIDELQARDNFSTKNLEKHLFELDFRNADKETSFLFLTILDEANKIFDQKFILHFPCLLFHQIDNLWAKHSEGKFGFSVQKKLWESLGQKDSEYVKLEKFASLVAWKSNGDWIKNSELLNYEFFAPNGHLPTLTFQQYENTDKWRPMWINNLKSLTKKFASC